MIKILRNKNNYYSDDVEFNDNGDYILTSKNGNKYIIFKDIEVIDLNEEDVKEVSKKLIEINKLKEEIKQKQDVVDKYFSEIRSKIF